MIRDTARISNTVSSGSIASFKNSINGGLRFQPLVHSFCDRTGLCTKPGSVGMRF